MNLTLDLSDLYLLRTGWIETLAVIADTPDACAECAPTVEECLEKLGAIQSKIRSTEERMAMVESHERNHKSTRAN